MQKTARLTLLMIAAAVLIVPGKLRGAMDPTYLSSAFVDARSYDSLSAAVAAARNKTLLITNPQKLTASLVIPFDVSVEIPRGGSIVKSTGASLVVNGPFSAGWYPVFEGFASGEVAFGEGSVREVVPQWWGGNSASSINKAINAYSVVYCPSGTYAIESEVLLKSNTHLRGERGGTVFLRPKGVRYAGKNIAGVPYADPFMVGFFTYGSGNYKARTNVTVEGITIDGNSYNSTESGRMAGIYLHSASKVRVVDCEVKNLGRTPEYVLSSGIIFSWVQEGTIKGCRSHDNTGDGIDVFAFNRDIIVEANEVYHNGVAGIEVEGRLGTSYRLPRNRGIVITGNIVRDNGGAPWGAGSMSYGHGINVTWSDDVIVSNNVVSSNTIWIGAIVALGTTNVVIANNAVHDNVAVSPVDPTGYGIAVFAQYDVYRENGVNRNVVIAHNALMNNQNGIFARDAVGVTIEGNTVERTEGPGNGIICEIGTVGKNLSIRSNIVRTNSTATAVGIRGNYDAVTIAGNQLFDSRYGISFTPDNASLSGLELNENTLDGVMYGLYAASNVTFSRGTIERNLFRNIRETDMMGKSGSPVVLSGFYVRSNIHDKGVKFWDGVGARPSRGPGGQATGSRTAIPWNRVTLLAVT